jgi:undecaprenyl diphosphate synthase
MIGKIEKKPMHIAISMEGHSQHSKKHKIPLEESYARAIKKVNSIINLQVELNIPVITLYLFTSRIKDNEHFFPIMNSLGNFFEELKTNLKIDQHKIKISVLGKWYDLPGRVVGPIKDVIDNSRDYDHFFLNLCINYDGQDEIVDACKIIARKIQAGRLDVDGITRETIKDNIYSSYFLPPDILFKTGHGRKLRSFLLWDSTHSHVYFSDKLWMEFKKEDILRAIREWASKK